MFETYPMSGVMIAMWAVALAIIIPIVRIQNQPAKITDDRVWFYDLGSEELVVGRAHWIPPVPAPSGALVDGEQALVRAMLYACGNCEENEPTLIYLEKFTPEAREKLASVDGDALKLDAADRIAIENGRLIRRPTDTLWVPAASAEGRPILNAHRSRCTLPSQQSTACAPPVSAGPAIRLPAPVKPEPEKPTPEG